VYDFIKNFSYYKEAWKGKIILLGPTDRTLHDYMRVPLSELASSGKRAAMSGIEIHANILSNLLENSFLYGVDKTKPIIIMALLFSLTAIWGGILGFLLLLFFAFLYYFFAFYSFFQYNLVFPYISIVVTGLSAFFFLLIWEHFLQLKEKQKIKNIFKQYVSEEVIEEIMSQPDKLSLGGEGKYLTILFADVRGFTSFSEKHTPEETVKILNSLLERAMEPVEKYKGILDKFIGDCIMLIFGSPTQIEDPEKMAVLCAWEMKQNLEKFSEESGINLGMGIGINSDYVVIGNLGTPAYKDYTVIGDGVNLAARLESVAQKGEILVSASVYEKVKDIVKVSSYSEIKVKGKEQKVKVYSIEVISP
jgi:adenylate cyclase